MARSLRQSWRRLPRLELWLSIIAAIALLIHNLGDFKLSRPAPPEEQQPAPAPREINQGDVLVLFPVASQSSSLQSLSTDQLWLNAIEREVGRARMIEAGSFTTNNLRDVAWVVVPRRASSQLERAQIDALQAWVNTGGVLILEQPEGPWRSLLNTLPVSSARRPTRNVTSFDGAITRGAVRDELLRMPIRTSIIPWTPDELVRGHDYEVYMEVDGLPALVSIPSGDGKVYMLLIDIGRAVANLTQGLTGEDFTLDQNPNEDASEFGPPFVAQMISDPLRGTIMVPFVDLLLRNLLLIPDQVRPIARLWAYPELHRGALLVTRTATEYASLSLELGQADSSRGYTTSYFISEGLLAPEHILRLARHGHSLELAATWADSHSAGRAITRSRTIFGHPWSVRPATMREQTTTLNNQLNPYPPAIAHRNLEGVWTTDILEGWSRLQAAGLLLDSTLGSDAGDFDPSLELFGYTHGTGHAWRPIDRNGNRFQIYELPVHSVDRNPGYSWPRLRRLIVESAERYHTTIVTDWRVDTLVEAPAWDALEGWQQVRALAHSQDLWVPTLSEYTTFLFRRLSSDISSTWDSEERLLTIKAQLPVSEAAQRADDTRTPAIAFPARIDGRTVDRVEVNGVDLDVNELSLSGDRATHLLATTPGIHEIKVWWGYGNLEIAPPE